MDQFTLQKRWEILIIVLQNGASSSTAARKLRYNFGKKEAPFVQFVQLYAKRVHEIGSTA